MSKKIDLILLVDDDRHDNFFHQRVIESTGVCEEVRIAKSGLDAIEYLKRAALQEVAMPDLIFLDINMPKMNGWEFVEAYGRLDFPQQTKIVMLTTSLNPEEKAKANHNPLIQKFISKPLTAEILEELTTAYFS